MNLKIHLFVNRFKLTKFIIFNDMVQEQLNEPKKLEPLQNEKPSLFAPQILTPILDSHIGLNLKENEDSFSKIDLGRLRKNYRRILIFFQIRR